MVPVLLPIFKSSPSFVITESSGVVMPLNFYVFLGCFTCGDKHAELSVLCSEDGIFCVYIRCAAVFESMDESLLTVLLLTSVSLILASDAYVDCDTIGGLVSIVNSFEKGRTAIILCRVHTLGIMASLSMLRMNGYWSSHILNTSNCI